jgi:hypothetical protein
MDAYKHATVGQGTKIHYMRKDGHTLCGTGNRRILRIYTPDAVTCERCLAIASASSPVSSQPEDAVTLRLLTGGLVYLKDVIGNRAFTVGPFGSQFVVDIDELAWAECDEVYDAPAIASDESVVEANIRLTKEVAILRALVAEQNAAIDELNRKLAAIRNDDMEELVNVVTGRADYQDNDLLSIDNLRAARDDEPFHFGD